ncbi:MAG: lytic murein transglycosylase B [Gammaproteobacteria bacterium]
MHTFFNKLYMASLITSVFSLPAVNAQAGDYASFAGNAKAEKFISRMVKEHDFDHSELKQLFNSTYLRDDIIKAMTRPAEGKPWYDYRPIFLTESRINGGIAFWKKHAALLADIEKKYGVDSSVVIAIVGVETRYGNNTGSYRVIDALSTLAFGYPPRGKFFSKELEQFLILTREEKVDIRKAKGSYAGAMGLGQFIPSSYREYAVDYDGDKRRDLWTSMGDILGSVANYLHVHGWELHGPVAYQAKAGKTPPKSLLDEGYKPKRTLEYFLTRDLSLDTQLDKKTPAAIISLKQKSGPEYWLTMKNFYVITRYNRSPLYAMAVFQLSQEIKAGFQKQAQKGK